MNAYQSIDRFNAEALAARHAYHADIAVQDGLCASCKWRKRDTAGRKRLCTTCRRSGVSSR